MSFSKNSYARIWEKEVDDKGRLKVRMSTNGKDKDGNLYQDFGAWVYCFGAARDKMDEVSEKDTIVLDSPSTENFYDKEKKVTYWTCKLFDFHLPENKTE